MKKNQFKIKALYAGVCMAMASQVAHAAASPYPALPPTLSSAVTPNIMLLIDNSASMLQVAADPSPFTRGDLCPDPNNNWSSCINNNTGGWRTTMDSPTLTPNNKMNVAKGVAKELIRLNQSLRWGIASFHVANPNTIGGSERGEAGIIVSNILQADQTTGGVSNKTILDNAIDSLRGRTATPLGEALLEVTRYFEGKTSYTNKPIPGGGTTYTSPIQYRCQKNFTIVLTDGDSTNDDRLPGSPNAAISYTRWNSAGSQETKSFSVCTGVSANCPASLEGQTTTPGFGSSTGRFRALRDVAKYANDLDMKPGSGNDADGKPYDDPKFPNQNMQTYTVGFGVDNDVLPAAAQVGAGKYYTALGQAELTSALSNAVSSIMAASSNAGGVAVLSDFAQADNYVYQPVFSPDGWYGELRRYKLLPDGKFDFTSLLEANAVLKPRAASSRLIYSAKTDASSTTAFVFNDTAGLSAMTAAQKAFLGATTPEQQNVINSLRGTNVTNFRDRTNNKLGDIIDAQPVVVSVPFGYSNDSTYTTFKTTQANRGMVFIGSNDGMLHGFNKNNMEEVLGYIPSSVYPNLKPITDKDYGNPSAPHVHAVNGPLRQGDVKISGAWKTLLVGGLGQGGQGYYALDVTTQLPSPSAPNPGSIPAPTPATTVKWEWSEAKDKSVGYSFPNSIIYNVRMGSGSVTPAVVLTNGYESGFDNSTDPAYDDTANSSALFILNANTGALIKKIALPATSTGLSAPAGVDFGQDGVLDYVYAGDVNGNMWRFDLTSADATGFKVATNPIFTAKKGTTAQPIIMRPAILPVNYADGAPHGNLVIFGTGKLLTPADRTDTNEQTLYGILDELAANPTTVPATKLVEQTIMATGSVVDPTKRVGSYRRVSDNTLDLTSRTELNLGWFVDLTDSSERLVASPMLYDDRVFLGTGVPVTVEKCVAGGKGWIMGLNPMTGGVMKTKSNKPFSFVDINNDLKSTDADMVNFGGTNAYASGYGLDGIPTELTFVQSDRVITMPTVANDGSTAGGSVALYEANYQAVYTANAPAGTQVGQPIPRPESKDGSGKNYDCTVGTTNCPPTNILKAPGGVRVVPINFRQIPR
ncbi:pilus assembly protein [Chitinimonas arctica]|nr:PilC/PilY family type IV pilus protein [Chitinimonas arctica]